MFKLSFTSQHGSELRRLQIASLMLFVVLFICAAAFSWNLERREYKEGEHAFSDKTDNIQAQIRNRMLNYEQVLLGIKGLYDASKSVERDEFHYYVSGLMLDKNFPGIQVVGYSLWLTPSELPKAIQTVRADGFPDFNIRPEGTRDNYNLIIYVEPFSGRNMAAFGYDMFTEENRRTAMSTAVETNETSITQKVKLVQEIFGPVQAGTIMYIPIYKKNLSISTAADRWKALDGFVAASFRLGDLMTNIQFLDRDDFNFNLYEGEAISDEKLLFSSPDSDHSLHSSQFSQIRHFNINNRIWTLEVFSSLKFDRQHRSHLEIWVFVFSTLFNVLLCLLMYFLASQRQRAIQYAERMTQDARERNNALKMSEERFQLALDSSAMGVWSLLLADNSVQWDSSMHKLFGVKGERILTTYESFLAFVHADDRQRVFEEIANAIEGKKGYESEYRIVWRDRSIHYLASRAKIVEEDGVATSLLGTCWDITERKRLDKVKTEFVSTVSHELRTPLTSITGALGLAASGALCELPEKAKQVLEIAYKNAQRLKLLINDLLDMDKLLEGKLEFHCELQFVMPLIERAVTENKSYADQMRVQFIIAPASSNPQINVEDYRLLQILANFLSNAAKFSKENSDIVVALSEEEGYARISVIDCGVGLSDEEKTHIFEKFYQADSSDTRKKGGTGLGLAITKEIAERMNGRVGFTSTLGVGSTFYAEFPIVRN